MKEQEVLAKYKIDTKVLDDFAKKNYPSFAANKSVIIQLYLASIGVQIDPLDFQVIRGTKKDIKDLVQDEWTVIEGVFGPRLRTNSYQACPICNKKVEGEYCQDDGKIEPVTNWFDSYVFGDNSGDVPLTIGPRFANKRAIFTGKVAKIRGNLNNQGEFSASQIEFAPGGEAIPQPLAGKEAQVSGDIDKKRISELLGRYEMRFADLKVWAGAQDPPVVSSLEKVIDELGYNVEDGMIKKKKPMFVPPAPTPTATPTPQPIIPTTAPATPNEDVEKLRKMVSIFSEVDLKSLQKWHEKEGLKTPLADILSQIPHTAKGEGEATILVFPVQKG